MDYKEDRNILLKQASLKQKRIVSMHCAEILLNRVDARN
jgi:hypothetical protein